MKLDILFGTKWEEHIILELQSKDHQPYTNFEM